MKLKTKLKLWDIWYAIVEPRKRRQYKRLLAAGWSDYEARAEVWNPWSR